MAVPLRLVVAAVILGSLFHTSLSLRDGDLLRQNDPNCVGVGGHINPQADVNVTGPIHKSIKLWQGVILLFSFGAFALFICLLHRVIRTYIYYDGHLLDTFFDAGGDVNFALVACSLVAKWTWTSTFSQSSANVIEYGLVGHFWAAAGMAIHLFLFSIVAAELRIKAPGAKTFLQVIYARFGPIPHIIMMIFAFLLNILVASMVIMEGVNIITAITEGLGREVTCVILAVVVAFFTVVGGIGGFMYVSYFACALTMSIMLVYFCDVFYNMSDRPDNVFSDWGEMYKPVSCGRAHPDNEKFSLLTFISKQGMIHGILFILSGFSSLFVNQSFWQSAVTAKPAHAVWGFIVSGVVWFAIPFCSSFVFGMTYWTITVQEGKHLISHEQAKDGLMAAYMSQRLMGHAGDFLMFVLVMVAVVTTCSGEVLSTSSIIIYDIYQTYIAPFRSAPIPENRNMSIRMQQAIKNEEYLEYDRRCVVLKHVVVVSVSCLLIPISLVMLTIGIDIQWLFMMTGVLVGSCVLPLIFSVIWHRVTGPGVAAGVLVGFIAAIIGWLVMASTYEGGLKKFRDNTGEPLSFLVGTAVAIGMGGLICVLISLPCGGCAADRLEENEWSKTTSVESVIMPWRVKYASDIGTVSTISSKSQYLVVRHAYKSSEICAYIFGVVLSVIVILVWPACMLTTDLLSKSMFKTWVLLVLVWTAVAAAFLIIVPLLYEIIQTCNQACNNRMWSYAGHSELIDEESKDSSFRRSQSSLNREDSSGQTFRRSQTSLNRQDSMGHRMSHSSLNQEKASSSRRPQSSQQDVASNISESAHSVVGSVSGSVAGSADEFASYGSPAGEF